jgi:hypothetical protein
MGSAVPLMLMILRPGAGMIDDVRIDNRVVEP